MSTRALYPELRKFIDIVDAYLGGQTQAINVFHTSVSTWSEYALYLDCIYRRIKGDHQKLQAAYQAIQKAGEGLPNHHALTTEEIAAFQEFATQQLQVKLDIESFIIFSDILLDRLVYFFTYYFRPIGGIQDRSYHRFITSSRARLAEKSLTEPCEQLFIAFLEKILPSLEWLQVNLGDYRDDFITHKKRPRALRVLTWQLDKLPQIQTSNIYPRPDEEPKVSPEIDELNEHIFNLLREVIDFLGANVEHSIIAQRY